MKEVLYRPSPSDLCVRCQHPRSMHWEGVLDGQGAKCELPACNRKGFLSGSTPARG